MPPPRLAAAEQYLEPLRGAHGIEIGGPSGAFATTLPLYDAVGSLDGVNFAGSTMWEGEITAGATFTYRGRTGAARTGRQFIAEASELAEIPDEHYDFLISSNCLEHLANPLRALAEWRRVVRPGGYVVLVIPDPESNFDHRRPVTSFAHLVEDFDENTTEHDLTHLDEILRLHDLERDPPAGTLAQFEARSRKNFEHRGLHHHVFDPSTIAAMVEHAGLEMVRADRSPTDFYTLCRRGELRT